MWIALGITQKKEEDWSVGEGKRCSKPAEWIRCAHLGKNPVKKRNTRYISFSGQPRGGRAVNGGEKGKTCRGRREKKRASSLMKGRKGLK